MLNPSIADRLRAWCLRAAIMVCLIGVPAVALASATPQIWLAPLDNMKHPPPMSPGAVDYTNLFAPTAAWPEQIPQVKVFKIYSYFAGRASDAELSVLIKYLQAHGIKLALEDGPLTPSKNCGNGIEGYNGAHLAPLARRIKDLGGTLSYLAMDEPMTFGRFYTGKQACHASLMSLARNAAVNLKALRAVMPNIIVGDVEIGMNPTATGDAAWADTMRAWALDFQAAYGKPLAFMDLDMNWSENWLPSVQAIFPVLHQEHVGRGIIINASWLDTTDPSWTGDAKAHFKALEQAGIMPDQAVFQTWKPNPTHVLPPNNPFSLTGVVHAYLESLTPG